MCRMDPHLKVGSLPLEFLRNHPQLPALPPRVPPALFPPSGVYITPIHHIPMDSLGVSFGKASWAACAQRRGDGVWDGRKHPVEAAPEGISAPTC